MTQYRQQLKGEQWRVWLCHTGTVIAFFVLALAGTVEWVDHVQHRPAAPEVAATEQPLLSPIAQAAAASLTADQEHTDDPARPPSPLVHDHLAALLVVVLLIDLLFRQPLAHVLLYGLACVSLPPPLRPPIAP